MQPLKTRILIVDDQPTNLKVLADLLVAYGFDVLVAKDGESALLKLQRILPDLILLDILMPGLDGFETCRQIKSSTLTRDIPIIFLTALSDPVDKIKGLTLGAVDYITKPLQHEEVIARVNTHLRLHSLTRQLEEQNALLREEVRSRKLAELALRRSEEKFSKAFRSNPGAMMIMTVDEERVVEANSIVCQLLGYDLEDFLGKSLTDLKVWGQETTYQEFRHDIQSNGQLTSREVQWLTRSGEEKDVLLAAELIELAGQPHILIMLYDITTCKKAVARLQQQERQYRTVVETSPVIIWSTDAEGRFTFINHAVESILGYAPDRLLGHYFWEAAPLSHYSQDKLAFQKLQQGITLTDYESVRILKDGTQVPLLVKAVPLLDPDQQLTEVIGTAADLRDRQRGQAAQNRAEVLERLNQLKDEFIQQISHEMRTPLTTLQMLLHLMGATEKPHKQQEYRLKAVDQCQQEINMINDLLDLQRLESGTFQIMPQQRELLPWIQTFSQPFVDLFSQCEIRFRLQTAPHLSSLYTDFNALERILRELLIHARQFTPPQGEIDMSLEQVPEGLKLKISHASQLQPEEISRLFEKFFRPAPPKNWKDLTCVIIGTGLGMPLVKRLINRLQGTLGVENHNARLSFTMEIPNMDPITH